MLLLYWIISIVVTLIILGVVIPYGTIHVLSKHNKAHPFDLMRDISYSAGIQKINLKSLLIMIIPILNVGFALYTLSKLIIIKLAMEGKTKVGIIEIKVNGNMLYYEDNKEN